MKKYCHQESNIGTLTLVEENGKICNIIFGRVEEGQEEDSPVLKAAVQQLDEYFAGTRKSFDLPLAFNGTDFQIAVWKSLINIPYGKTISYKGLAEMVGNPKGYRAVGGANNKNPIPIIVPCHRVIGANGNLVGYALGLEIKQKLLDLEQSMV